MANEFEKMNEEELEQAAGGKSGIVGISGSTYGHDHHHHSSTHKTVGGLSKGYLAVRSSPGYNYSNEIGQLYNGDKVDVTGSTVWVNGDFNGNTPYTWVTVRKNGQSGYVNANFLH